MPSRVAVIFEFLEADTLDRQKCPRGQRARLPVLSGQQGRIQAPQTAFISSVAGHSTVSVSHICVGGPKEDHLGWSLAIQVFSFSFPAFVSLE